MTLNQLRYAVTTADSASMTEAAGRLFISQPSLTASLHALEEELGIQIFSRTNRGVHVTTEGEEFLGYARQMLEQESLIRSRYIDHSGGKPRFCVSTQHYSFAVEAFVRLLRNFDGERYDFHLRETQTYQILEDVGQLRSEVGILYKNSFNGTVIDRTIAEHELTFQRLFRAKPHVFLSKRSPLAAKESLTLDDLAPYPRLSYEQGEHNAFYFSEEILSTLDRDRDIVVTDRATLFNLLIGLNGYTICSGVISEELNGAEIIARPLQVEDYMDIGYVVHAHRRISAFAAQYIAYLQECVEE